MPSPHPLQQRTYFTHWLVLAIALLALGGATTFNLRLERERTEEREQSRLLTQARVIQENIEGNLATTNQVLEELRSRLPEYGNLGQLSDHLKLLTEAMPGIRTLLILDGGGTVLASNRPELPGKNFAFRDYFKTARLSQDPDTLFVSPPFKTSLGVYGINLARAIPGRKGEFAGLIVATLDPEYFRALMGSVLYSSDMWAAIAHGDGIQFLMVPEQDGQVGKNLAQPGSFFSRHRDSGKEVSILSGKVYATGDQRMMAIRTIHLAGLKQDKPLLVAVSRELDSIYATWRRDARIQGGLFGLIALGSLLGLHVYRRRQLEFARKEAEAVETLAASERFLKTLTDNIPGMVGYWNSELRCRFANSAYLEWFDKTPGQMQGIHIREMMGEALFRQNEPYIRAALRGERQSFERTLTKADGSIGYTWAQYIPDSHEDGVHGFFVLVSDITELKRTEIALAESEGKLKAIIENEPECVKVLSADGVLLQMNRAGLNMIEADSERQVVGYRLTEIVVPQYRLAFGDLIKRVSRGESGTLQFEIIGLKGGHRWLDTHAVPMRDAHGEITGVLSVTRDITAHKKIEQELQQLAQTDSLTRLANRRHFTMQAEQELARTLRYGGPLSLLMMDIDHFKHINDTYGHKVGDLVLRQFADLARQELRGFDTVGRIGGEEFAVILPQTDSTHALAIAERLRKAVEEAAVALDQGLPIRFTVSIGVAPLAGTGANLDTLLGQADQALYSAKNSGRNRVCLYRPA